MPDGDADIGASGRQGADGWPVPPDCTRWRPRKIDINGAFYDIVRRPRLFRYAELRHFQDPGYTVCVDLPDGGDPDNAEYQERAYESRLWCMEFDADVQGDRKTLRVSFVWPDLFPTFEDVSKPSAVYPQGVKTFLGHELHPVEIWMNLASPQDCRMFAARRDWPSVREIRYVEYEAAAFGMLAEDREAAGAVAGAAAGAGVPREKRAYNTEYSPAKRRAVFDTWNGFQAEGGRRLKTFLEENREFCRRNGVTDTEELKKALDSERKERSKGRED